MFSFMSQIPTSENTEIQNTLLQTHRNRSAMLNLDINTKQKLNHQTLETKSKPSLEIW